MKPQFASRQRPKPPETHCEVGRGAKDAYREHRTGATEGGLSSGGGRLFGGQLGLATWINLLFISSEQALSGLKRSVERI
jgi:hypothetical protein